MLSDEALKTKLAQSPAERVTEEYINSRIAKTEYIINRLSTVCLITLDNGFIVEGFSACAKVENFDRAIGETYAYKNAYAKLWGFFGFLLVENGTLVK